MNVDVMTLNDLPVEVQIRIVHFLSKDEACKYRNISQDINKNMAVGTIYHALKNDSCFERVGSRLDIVETCLLKMVPVFPCQITHSMHCTMHFPKEIGFLSKQLCDGFEIVDGELQQVNTISHICECGCNINLHLEFVPKEGEFYSLYCVFPDTEILCHLKRIETRAIVIQKPEIAITTEFYNLMNGAVDWNGSQWETLMQKYLAHDSAMRDLIKGALRYEYNLGILGFQYTEDNICLGGYVYDYDKEIDGQVFSLDEILEIKEYKTMTLLHLACQNNASLEVIQLILTILGADEMCRDCSRITSSTPFHIVCNNGRADIMRYFISVAKNCHVRYEGIEPILVGCMRLACINGHMDIAKRLIEGKGIVIAHATAKHGTSCFFEAVKYGHLELVKFLIQASTGKNSLLLTIDNGGWSSLHEACQYGRLEIVKLLLEAGGERILNHADNQLFRPLHTAYKHGEVEIFKLLQEKEKYFNSE